MRFHGWNCLRTKDPCPWKRIGGGYYRKGLSMNHCLLLLLFLTLFVTGNERPNDRPAAVFASGCWLVAGEERKLNHTLPKSPVRNWLTQNLMLVTNIQRRWRPIGESASSSALARSLSKRDPPPLLLSSSLWRRRKLQSIPPFSPFLVWWSPSPAAMSQQS